MSSVVYYTVKKSKLKSWKYNFDLYGIYKAGQVGFEPTTARVGDENSTVELLP